MPSTEFPTWLTLEPGVDRYARVTVRQCHYSVPAKPIGRRVRVRLSTCTVTVFDGTSQVAVHKRITVRGEQALNLDHYLEVLQRKPGALPGATASVQARASGVFTQAHDASWSAARRQLGDFRGTHALVEVLLLHRHLPATDEIAGINAALQINSVKFRRRNGRGPQERPPDGPVPLGLILPGVVDLQTRRVGTDAEVRAELLTDARPLPAVAPYADLLTGAGS